jgi:hypothetical protein
VTDIAFFGFVESVTGGTSKLDETKRKNAGSGHQVFDAVLHMRMGGG